MIFLGEVNDIDRIINKMKEIEFEPFRIIYQGIGAFPTSSRAKIIWIGIDKISEQKLFDLAGDIVVKMTEVGFLPDKPFSPHMTLFRVKGSPIKVDDIILKYKDKIFGADTIDKVHLKKSELKASGPEYSSIYTIEAKKSK
jgi:2'-5' RNA ligase